MNKTITVAGHSIRLANIKFNKAGKRIDADSTLPYYSHSIMEAIQTCPKWGLIRYKERKYYRATYRAMALEAGSIFHEVAAALRLWQVLRRQNLPDHFWYHGARLFGETRLAACFRDKSDARDEALSFCFEILNSGEFYDDPTDNIRTLANLEETTIRYVDEYMGVMDKNDIWIADTSDATAPVGIEISFDMVIDEKIRYIGTIDGIVCNKTTSKTRLEENKTASRLDDAWRESFRVKFQPTGYMLGAILVCEELIDSAKIIGIKVKQTRSHEDYRSIVETRNDFHLKKFFRSLFFTHDLATMYADDPLNAAQFTHSCSRYFRPCGFIDLCASEDADDEREIYDSMERTPLSPSEQAIFGVEEDEETT